MAEYIEREAFIKILKETKNDCEHYHNKVVCDFAIKMANLMPTADVQEVRHASWMRNQEDMYWGNSFIRRNCSICGGSPIYHEGLGTYKLTPYCPHCGAKMDKE